MSLLGTMMLRAGLLSDDQLSTAQTHATRKSLAFVEAVLDLGYSDQDGIVTFLHSKLMIPRVGASVLQVVDDSSLARIPAALAHQFTVLPVSVDEDGNLTLAMADPTDMRAVDAISDHTGAYLVRAVAPLHELRAAITNYYGPPPTAGHDDAGQRPSYARQAGSVRPTAVIPAAPAVDVPVRKPGRELTPPGSLTAASTSMKGPGTPLFGAPSAPSTRARAPSGPAPIVPVPTPRPVSAPVAAPSIPTTPRPVSAPVPAPVPRTPSAPTQRAPEPVDQYARPPLDENSRAPTLHDNYNPSETIPGQSTRGVTQEVRLHDEDIPSHRQATPDPSASRIQRSRAPASWNPPQQPMASPVPLSPEAFNRILPRSATVTTRDQITSLLLDFLADGFDRVIMFTHVKDEIRGRDARGEDLMVEAVRQIRIPASGPSLFSTVIEHRNPYFGPMRTDTAIDAAFHAALGGVQGNVLVVPVVLRGKVPLLVFACGSRYPVDANSLHELTTTVGQAFERLIVAQKSRKR